MSSDSGDLVLTEFLKDPLGDRQKGIVDPPPRMEMSKDFLFPRKEKINVDALKKHLSREGHVSQDAVIELLHRTADIFATEPNILKLKDPVTVVGDIHGQFYDMLKLLELGGDPGATTQYLFLGDFVDRGSYSVEVCLLLFAYKVMYPKRVWLCRGNHECRQMTAFFNFRDECEYKYESVEVYDTFMQTFDALPLGALINGKFLAIHGGLSPNWVDVDDAQAISRIQEPPRDGLFCDILWSDPSDSNETVKAANKKEKFSRNEIRGCAWFFSFDATRDFLNKNSLLSVIRAHEAQLEGYKMHKTNEATGFPSVITIFSAPNYCDVYGNKGAILKFNHNTMNILQFHVSAHPYHLPNFMNVFTWSLPFMAEKVSEMLYFILQPLENEEDKDADLPLPPEVELKMKEVLGKNENASVRLAQTLASHLIGDPSSSSSLLPEQWERTRKKVRAVATLGKIFKRIREDNESILKLKGACPADSLSPQALLAGRALVKGLVGESKETFSVMRGIDQNNEKRPIGTSEVNKTDDK